MEAIFRYECSAQRRIVTVVAKQGWLIQQCAAQQAPQGVLRDEWALVGRKQARK